jgi:hypothetical protein
MAQFKSKHAVLLTLRSVSMQCNAMQCNAIQCNAMQYNAIQCNACTMQCMYEVNPSVRNEVSQSFFLFFLFFLVSTYGSPSVCTEHRLDGQTSFSYFLKYVRMSRMDRQVSVISVQFQFSHTVKSVRPYGGPNQKKKKKKIYVNKTETQIRSEVIPMAKN